jgi:hypothetical protein
MLFTSVKRLRAVSAFASAHTRWYEAWPPWDFRLSMLVTWEFCTVAVYTSMSAYSPRTAVLGDVM